MTHDIGPKGMSGEWAFCVGDKVGEGGAPEGKNFMKAQRDPKEECASRDSFSPSGKEAGFITPRVLVSLNNQWRTVWWVW